MSASRPRFISLADALRPRPTPVEPVPVVPIVQLPAAPATVATIADSPPALSAPLAPLEQAAAIRTARLFRAALGDAYEALLADLVREVAVDIVARELRLADVDIALIARRLIAERFAEEPIRLRVAPADAAVTCDLPVIADPSLEAGDAILECRSGSIDARLGVRLAAVLECLQP